MAERRIGIIVNGATGRMGTNQHLARSILAIREAGGLALANGDMVMPEPVLVGRSAARLRALAAKCRVDSWTTDLDAALSDDANTVFFDTGATLARRDSVGRAIDAGKHVYCEKPAAATLAQAVDLARRARAAGIRHGVVQDKLYLPGPLKLAMLKRDGFFGRVLSVRIEFGYWVFEGDLHPGQRPAWNYRREEGGGIILDMLSHWRYLLDNLAAPVKSVCCLGAIHLPERWDEAGEAYATTADDAAYATIELEGGAIAQANSSWCTRVRRDDLVTFHIDGTAGSAVAGRTDCWIQPRVAPPRPVWNPDEPRQHDFRADWQRLPDTGRAPNAFRAQWEGFLRHVAENAPWAHCLEEGAKGVQFAECALESWSERRFVDIPALEV